MSEMEAGSDRERIRHLMMAYLDDELAPDDRGELERLLETDPALREEWQRLRRVKEVTADMALKGPDAEVWDDYWTSVYRRLERGIGWVLVSLGAVVLVSYGLWTAVKSLLEDTTTLPLVRWAMLVALVGAVVLFVSVVREKLFVRRRDPYKDVKR